MKKINKFIEKNIIIILSVFIVANPILDVITSVNINYLNWDFTIGMIVRFIFMIFAGYYIMFIPSNNKKIRTINIIMFSSFFLYSIVYIVINYEYSFYTLFIKCANLFKYLYFYVLLLFFINIGKKLKSLDYRWLNYSFIIYLFFIFVPNLFGGLNTYDYAKLGGKGIFNSANEIGAIISLLFPLFLYSAMKSKRKIGYFIISIIYLFITLTLGTKLPFCALILTLVLFLITYYIKSIKSKNVKLIKLSFISFIIIILLMLFVVPKTNFYKNIVIHMKHFNINSIKDVFSSKENIDHIIFSERLSLIENNYDIFMNAKPMQKIFGLGQYSTINSVIEERKIIEIDFFDIMINFGLFAFVMYIFSLVLIAYVVIKNYKNNKYKVLLPLFIFLLSLLIAFFTGHVFLSPAVSFYIPLLAFYDFSFKKKKVLFAANTLEMGGIEKSLINLLKELDHEKYEITLVLEKKTGVLLKNIPHHVKIINYAPSHDKKMIVRKTKNFIKRIIWIIKKGNYFDYAFTYATYSFAAGFVVRTASINKSIFIHSDYVKLYKNNEKKINDFFKSIKITKYENNLFVSNESRNNFLKYYKLDDKCIVCNNIIDYKSILKMSEEKMDLKLLKDKKNINIGFVGRIDNESKNFDRMISILSELKDCKIKMFIIGDGKDINYLKKLIKKHSLEKTVMLLGEKINPYPYIKNFDYLLLTSNYEGFPVVYNESILLSTPIITTLDITDDVIDLKEGFGYIISDNPKKASEQIRKIIIGEHVVKEIDYKKINKKRIDTIEKIISGGKHEI